MLSLYICFSVVSRLSLGHFPLIGQWGDWTFYCLSFDIPLIYLLFVLWYVFCTSFDILLYVFCMSFDIFFDISFDISFDSGLETQYYRIKAHSPYRLPPFLTNIPLFFNANIQEVIDILDSPV